MNATILLNIFLCACVEFNFPFPYTPLSLQTQATVLKEVEAVADYTAQYEDELTFRAGDKIQITLESESEHDHRSLKPLPMRTPRIVITMMQ